MPDENLPPTQSSTSAAIAAVVSFLAHLFFSWLKGKATDEAEAEQKTLEIRLQEKLDAEDDAIDKEYIEKRSTTPATWSDVDKLRKSTDNKTPS